MQPAHRRHDISDTTWTLLVPLLPGQAGMWGRIAKDNRLFINAVFLDSSSRSPLERSSPGLWRLEEYTPAVLSLARQRNLGKGARGAH